MFFWTFESKLDNFSLTLNSKKTEIMHTLKTDPANIDVINSPNKKWYVILSNPRAEKRLAKRIENLNIEVYLPTFKELRQWSDRKKKVESPLIPSTLFVHTEQKKLYDLYDVQGVKNILRDKGRFAVVKAHEIENLKIVEKEWNGGKIQHAVKDMKLQPGEEVIINKGHFQGLIGKSVEIKSKHRILIQIDVIQQNFIVDISKNNVEKVNN